MTSHIFIEPTVYPFPIRVIIGDIEYLLSELKEIFKEDQVNTIKEEIDEHTLGYTFALDDSVVMWLSEYPTNSKALSILNHEVFHVVHKVMDLVGITLGWESDEAFAYYTSYISKQIYNNLNLF